MSLDPRLLEILACPACHGELANSQTTLDCPACQLSFPIRDGIPVLLIDEAVQAQE